MGRRSVHLLLAVAVVALSLWLLDPEGVGGLLPWRGGERGAEAALAEGPGATLLEEELRARAELRLLPGMRRAPRGQGLLAGAVHVFAAECASRPLCDVEVQVLGFERDKVVPRVERTDAEGAFLFVDLPAEAGYALVVRHAPFREVVLRGLAVEAGKRTDIGTILLGAPTSISGEVVDGVGRPIVGALVQVLRDTSRPGRLDLRRALFDLASVSDDLTQAHADADGTFRLRDVPPGRYVLRVGAPEYGTAFREVRVTADERAPELRIVLDPGAGFHGRVLDETQRPIAEARVVAVALPGSGIERMDKVETRSLHDGSYRLDGLVPGVRWFVEAWATGFAPTGRVLRPTRMEPLDLVLGAAGTVVGRITDAASGAGVAHADVTLLAGRENALSPLSAVTDADGSYAFPAVGAGPVFFFRVEADGYPADTLDPSRAAGLVVEAGHTLVIDRTLAAGAIVSGRVSDARSARPVPWVTVAFADPRHRFEGERTALTDATGRYELAGLRPGTWEVRTSAHGFAPLTGEAQVRLEIAAGARDVVHDLALDSGAALAGALRAPEGLPVSGARLEALVRDGGGFRPTDLVAVSDAGGAWRIAGVPPGTEVCVEARHDAWARTRSASLRLAPGEERRIGLTMDEGLRLTGRVADARGRPLEGARVRWGRVEAEDDRRLGNAFRADELLGRRVVRTDPAGSFSIERLEPGRLLLKVEHDGWADWYRNDVAVPANPPGPHLEIVLKAAGAIRGRVRESGTGRPIADAWVYAEERRPEDEGEADPGHVRSLVSTQTAADGTYVLEPVPPGRYDVTVWLAVGYRAAVQDGRDPSVRRRDVAADARGVDFELERLPVATGD